MQRLILVPVMEQRRSNGFGDGWAGISSLPSPFITGEHILMRIPGVNIQKKVKSLDDAYAKGYFSGGLSRKVLMASILKHNPEFRTHSTVTHTGLFSRNQFIIGISKLSRIPQFTLVKEKTGQILCISWKKILESLHAKGYRVDEKLLENY